MLPWSAALCATVGAVVGQETGAMGSSALGDGLASTSLLIDCAALDGEHRAVQEARARAQLVAAPRPTGEIAIQCEAQVAVVGWRAEDEGRRRETVLLDPEQARAIDGLRGAVHAMRFAAAGGRGVESDSLPVSSASSAPVPAPVGAVGLAS